MTREGKKVRKGLKTTECKVCRDADLGCGTYAGADFWVLTSTAVISGPGGGRRNAKENEPNQGAQQFSLSSARLT